MLRGARTLCLAVVAARLCWALRCANNAVVLDSSDAGVRLPDGLYLKHGQGVAGAAAGGGDDDDDEHLQAGTGQDGALYDGKPWYSDGFGHFLFWIRNSRQWTLGKRLGGQPFLAGIESVAATPDRAVGSWNAFVSATSAMPLPGEEGSVQMDSGVTVRAHCVTAAPTPAPTLAPTRAPTPSVAPTPAPTPQHISQVCEWLRVSAINPHRARQPCDGLYRLRHAAWLAGRPRFKLSMGRASGGGASFYLQYDDAQRGWAISPLFGDAVLLAKSQAVVPSGLMLKPVRGSRSASVRVTCTTGPPTPAPTFAPTPVPSPAPTPKHHGMTVAQLDAADARAAGAAARMREARFSAKFSGATTLSPTRSPTPTPTPLVTMRPHAEGGGPHLRIQLRAAPRSARLCARVRLAGPWRDHRSLRVAGDYVLKGVGPSRRPAYFRATGGGMWLYYRAQDREWAVSHQLGAPPFLFVAESAGTTPEQVSSGRWNEGRGRQGYFSVAEFEAECTARTHQPARPHARARDVAATHAPPPPVAPAAVAAAAAAAAVQTAVAAGNDAAHTSDQPLRLRRPRPTQPRSTRDSSAAAVHRMASPQQWRQRAAGLGLLALVLAVMARGHWQRSSENDLTDGTEMLAPHTQAAAAAQAPSIVPAVMRSTVCIEHQATSSELESLAAAGRATYSMAAVPFGDVDDDNHI